MSLYSKIAIFAGVVNSFNFFYHFLFLIWASEWVVSFVSGWRWAKPTHLNSEMVSPHTPIPEKNGLEAQIIISCILYLEN